MKEIKNAIMYTPPFSRECHSALSIARFVEFWQVHIYYNKQPIVGTSNARPFFINDKNFQIKKTRYNYRALHYLRQKTDSQTVRLSQSLMNSMNIYAIKIIRIC